MLQRVREHGTPFHVGLVGGPRIVTFEGYLEVFGGYAAGEVAAGEEVEVASDQVHRVSSFVILRLAVLVGAMFSNFSLESFVEFEVMD